MSKDNENTKELRIKFHLDNPNERDAYTYLKKINHTGVFLISNLVAEFLLTHYKGDISLLTKEDAKRLAYYSDPNFKDTTVAFNPRSVTKFNHIANTETVQAIEHGTSPNSGSDTEMLSMMHTMMQLLNSSIQQGQSLPTQQISDAFKTTGQEIQTQAVVMPQQVAPVEQIPTTVPVISSGEDISEEENDESNVLKLVTQEEPNHVKTNLEDDNDKDYDEDYDEDDSIEINEMALESLKLYN